MAHNRCLLFIDTSLDGYTMGIRFGGAVFQDSAVVERGLDAVLLVRLQDLLDQAGCGLSDVDTVIAALGPGAFTGIRIGLSVVKSFGLALDIPVLGMNTFDAVKCSYGDSPALVVLESKREALFVQGFAVGIFESPDVANPQEILRALERVEMCTVVGNAAVDGVDAVEWTGLDVARIFEAFDADSDMFSKKIEPIYLRDADVSCSKKIQRVLGK